MNFDKYAVVFYRAALLACFCMVFVPMLFEIGTPQPAYTFSAGTWLTGLALSAVPAFLGYRIGRAEERASKGGGNA